MSISIYQNQVARLSKEKASLEQKRFQIHGKVQRLRTDVAKHNQEILKAGTPSLAASKKRQLETKGRELGRQLKAQADLETKIARKTQELLYAQKSLDRAEAQERKKRDSEEEKRRKEQKKHL